MALIHFSPRGVLMYWKLSTDVLKLPAPSVLFMNPGESSIRL